GLIQSARLADRLSRHHQHDGRVSTERRFGFLAASVYVGLIEQVHLVLSRRRERPLGVWGWRSPCGHREYGTERARNVRTLMAKIPDCNDYKDNSSFPV